MKTFVRITSAFVLKDGWVQAVLAMFLHVVLASRVRFSVSSKLPKKSSEDELALEGVVCERFFGFSIRQYAT